MTATGETVPPHLFARNPNRSFSRIEGRAELKSGGEEPFGDAAKPGYIRGKRRCTVREVPCAPCLPSYCC